MPVRSSRPARSRAHRASGVHRFRVARILARRAPRAAVRLPRLRTVRSGKRPSLQPPQAIARSVCRHGHRRYRLERRALRLSGRIAARRPFVRPSRQRRRYAEVRRRRHGVHLGTGSAAAHALARFDRIRAARARLHHEAPRRPARTARKLRRPCLTGSDRVPLATRRHRDRAFARTKLRRRPAFDSKRPAQLLGLQPDFVLCAIAAVSVATGLGRV